LPVWYILGYFGVRPSASLKGLSVVSLGSNWNIQFEIAGNKADSTQREVERVELPSPAGAWFDLIKNKWVWEYHPKVDSAEQAAASGLARLETLEGLVQRLRDKDADAKFLLEMTKKLSLAKLHLMSAQT
jgi:hypothetical protein